MPGVDGVVGTAAGLVDAMDCLRAGCGDGSTTDVVFCSLAGCGGEVAEVTGDVDFGEPSATQ